MEYLSPNALYAAIKIGVDEGLLRKRVDIQADLDRHATINRMIKAAIREEILAQQEED